MMLKHVFLQFNPDFSSTNTGPVQILGGTGAYAGRLGHGVDNGRSDGQTSASGQITGWVRTTQDDQGAHTMRTRLGTTLSIAALVVALPAAAGTGAVAEHPLPHAGLAAGLDRHGAGRRSGSPSSRATGSGS